MKRIFPFNWKTGKWHNYSSFLNWLDKDITSIQQYINVFNPNYKILNESYSVLNSNTLQETTIKPNNENYWDGVEVDGEIKKCYFPENLKFREGYFNEHDESYLCFLTDSEKVVIKEMWNNFIEEGKIIKFPLSYIIFSLQSPNGVFPNKQNFNINNYLLFSKPNSSWYLPSGGENSIQFKFIENAMFTTGSNINFNLELQPTRFFITQDKAKKWISGGNMWSLTAGVWASNTGKVTINISNLEGNMWTNSFPLMHKIMIKQGTQYESFITEDYSTTKLANVANHQTTRYNINIDNIENEETKDWEDLLQILIL